MGFLGLTFERRYPFDGGCRALTADEILRMHVGQAMAMQNAWPKYQNRLSYFGAMVGYQPTQRPLDERFSEFKERLAAARARHGMSA